MLFACRTNGLISFNRLTARPDDDLVIHVSSNNVLSLGKAETLVVVAVGRVVVVTDGGTDVPAVVVPRAAPDNAVIAFDLSPVVSYTTLGGCRRKFSFRHSRLSVPAVIACTAL